MCNDGCHRLTQGLLTLVDGIDEPASLLDLVSEEGHCLTALARSIPLSLVLLEQSQIGGTEA